jgi:hypothetical protein
MNAMRLSIELVEFWSMTDISFPETGFLPCCLLAREREEAVAMVTALAVPIEDLGRVFSV